MIRSYWTAALATLALFTFACSVQVDDAGAGEEDVGETGEALTNVPGLTVGVFPIGSQWFPSAAGPGVPHWEFGCRANFTDNVHRIETRCILQEFTPQTNSWRSISPWYIDSRVGSIGMGIGTVSCAQNHVSVLRTINRSRVQAASGNWTDLEQLIGPALSVRCANEYTN